MHDRDLMSGISAKNAGKSKLLDDVRGKMRALHVAKRTEEAYVSWIYRYLLFNKGKFGDWVHPSQLGSNDVNAFLTMLAVERNVAASTQNQALSALVFLYSKVLNSEIKLNAVRAKRPQKLPVVMSIAEVVQLLKELSGTVWLLCSLMYGSGLRVMEACRLRVKDIDFDRKQIVVREGKGAKDRFVPLPQRLVEPLRMQLKRVAKLHQEDLERGAGWVWLPYALAVKYPEAGRSLAWQYVFPGRELTRDSHPREALVGGQDEAHVTSNDLTQLRRHHIHESTVQSAVTKAVVRTNIAKNISCHTL